MRLLLPLAIVIPLFLLSVPSRAEDRLVIEQPQTAVISGFRKMWDQPTAIDGLPAEAPADGPAEGKKPPAKPGPRIFDAAHRSLLVRFPDAAEKIAAELAKGKTIQKVELQLPFLGTEIEESTQVGYNLRTSFGAGPLFHRVQPQWHAIAWALRKPWLADPELGPTFNAYINGTGYWGKYAAQDAADRFDRQFGPAEVSYQATDGAMDITASLSEAAFGKTVGERLRRLSDCGFLVRKWEAYDFRFREPGQGAYEWAVATGGRGLKIDAPRLVVTFAPGKSNVGKLPPPADVRALAGQVKDGKGGRPTAVMPDEAQLKKIIETFALQKPAWMSDWQWQRVGELDRLGGGYRIPETAEGYNKWIDAMLADPPRYWNGWDVPDRLLCYYLYKDALPPAVADYYFTEYWTAWLMPDRPTKMFEHPQAIELWHKGKNVYYETTGDWRGNASFFRDGYCYQMSTMNFNHTAAMGALLAGNMIGSQYAMADGRHGLEHWPLRTWCWLDGSTQESIDHYYFSLTLSAQKMFADFGPTRLDRMMGMSMMAKSIEELTSAYHPGLRRFIASSTRTCVPQYLLITQDGLQHIVHTLSRSGALHDLAAVENQPEGQGAFQATEPITKLPVIGADTPPGRVAQLATTTPWAPEWAANMVDAKPIPYEMTNAYTQWGGHRANPLWRRTYLGANYGLGSTDLYDSCVPIMGHWRRQARQVSTIEEIGTMTMRYGINKTNLVNQAHGWLNSYGMQATLQHRNKMVVVTSPYPLAGQGDIRSLQSTIALWDYQQPAPTWEIYIDGQKIPALPARAKAGQKITIKDGVSYIGVIGLPATNLGRKDEVVLEEGEPQTWQNMEFKPALVIHNYNMQADEPLPPDGDRVAMDNAYGGFVFEFGDEAEYGSFDKFQQHMMAVTLEAVPVVGKRQLTEKVKEGDKEVQRTREVDQVTLNIKCVSGQDTLAMGVKTEYAGGPTPNCFTHREVNGVWPYLVKGLERDTSLTQQGSLGRLEKNGAVLVTSPGCMAYIQTEPVTGTYAGFNPLPNPSFFSLSVPGDVSVRADGRLGLARVVVQPAQGKLWVDHVLRADQNTPDIAAALLVLGLKKAPVVELNGQPLKGSLKQIKLPEGQAYVIPLGEKVDLKAVQDRYARVQKLLSGQVVDASNTLVQDWYVVGPFPGGEDYAGFDKVFPPEQKQDLSAAYATDDGKELRWKRILPAGAAALGKGTIDLVRQFQPNQNVLAYAYTVIRSDRDREAMILAGSDDTITIWVNGQEVLANKVARAITIDEEKVMVRLKKGDNRVLVKVCQGGGDWCFAFRVADDLGMPITEGLTIGFEEARKD